MRRVAVLQLAVAVLIFVVTIVVWMLEVLTKPVFPDLSNVAKLSG